MLENSDSFPALAQTAGMSAWLSAPNKRSQLPPASSLGSLCASVPASNAVPQRPRSAPSRAAEPQVRWAAEETGMGISSFDHVAIPTNRPEEMIAFYGRLGFMVPGPEEWREAGVPFFSVFFGDQKINFHTPAMWQNPDFQLRGPSAAPGCGDFCFVWEGGSRSLERTLEAAGAPIVAGPIELQGARGKGTSVYIRDPDENLLEFIVYE